MRKKTLAAGLTLLCLAIIGFIVPRAMRTTIILELGIVMANNLNMLYIPFAALSAITLAFAFIPARRRPASYVPEIETKVPGKDTLEPDNVREMLKECQEKHPSYWDLYNECMRQIGLIKEQQDSFEKLIQLNNAGFLHDAISTLRLAEQTILRNLMTAVNRGIVEKTDQMIDTDKEIDFKNLLQRVISANEKVFDTNQRFLIRASTAVSSKRMEQQSNADTEAWIQALEGLVLPSDIFDEKRTPQPFQTP